MEHIAELQNVGITKHKNSDGEDFKIAWGTIFNDKAEYGNHPIADGHLIHTSVVKDIVEEDGSTYLITNNSIYKVIGKIKHKY